MSSKENSSINTAACRLCNIRSLPSNETPVSTASEGRGEEKMLAMVAACSL